MKICGIDPSITSTGKCIMTLDEKLDITDIKFYGYTDKNKYVMNTDRVVIDKIPKDYPKMNMFDRQNLVYAILEKDMDDVEYIAFEGYAYAKGNSSSIFQLGEFIGGEKKLFYDAGKGIVIYPPMVVKRFATGNGNADKSMMASAIQNQYPDLYPTEFHSLKQYGNPHSDLCDAFWMADVLRHHIKYDKLGPESIDDGKRSLLESPSTKGAESIVETRMHRKAPKS